jgi:hypothetical protein
MTKRQRRKLRHLVGKAVAFRHVSDQKADWYVVEYRDTDKIFVKHLFYPEVYHWSVSNLLLVNQKTLEPLPEQPFLTD